MGMTSVFPNSRFVCARTVLCALLPITVLSGSLLGQADLKEAEALFAEGKTFAAVGSIHSATKALEKFEDAVALFTVAGATQKIREVTAEHGLLLLRIGKSYLDAGRHSEAKPFNFGTTGKVNEFKCDRNSPFSHPASWSPFILIGNWR